MTALEAKLRQHLRYNLTVNLFDAAFFGLAWGFGSFGTIIPLFVSRLTDSAVLIGLVPAIHAVGWQLPQLFTAGWVSRMRRYKPAVMLMTIHERIPYLGLAAAAWLYPTLGAGAALWIVFALLIWQGLGSGLTANPWQSMIAKIIPSDSRGTFLGVQAAVANILISLSAVGAGYLLDLLDTPLDFAICFLISSAGLGLSMIFLGLTREPEDTEKVIPDSPPPLWQNAGTILRRDANFVRFLVARNLSLLATMGFSFYIVYALRAFAMDEVTAGLLTAALTVSQTLANASMGWLGDRLGHRWMMVAGSLSLTLSALIAWAAPGLEWFYPVFILAGLANVSIWTIGMALTVEFGSESERPLYIGLSQTLVAPVTILGPILGGVMADLLGYQSVFMLSAVCGLLTAAFLLFLVRDPRSTPPPQGAAHEPQPSA